MRTLEAMTNVMEFTKDMTMSSLKIPKPSSEPYKLLERLSNTEIGGCRDIPNFKPEFER